MNKYFLSCDWGTSSFRLRLIEVATGKMMQQLSGAEGISSVHAQWKTAGKSEDKRLQFYLNFLQQQCKKIETAAGFNIDGIPMLISGMASSTIGMLELPYTQMPFSVTGNDLQTKEIKRTELFPHTITLISGAKTNEDVMRGEETQLIGCADRNSKDRQVFIFSGTHSKHISVEEGMAVAVETFMTGEFFELLTKSSILSASVEAGGNVEEKENGLAFAAGVKESTQQNLLHSSFLTRTNQLFQKYSKAANYFYVSGLLIGTELQQLVKKDISNITIVGEEGLQAGYLLALQLLKINAVIHTADSANATINGQWAVYRNLHK